MKTFNGCEERLIWKILNHSILTLVAFSLLISYISSIKKIIKICGGDDNLEPLSAFFLIFSVLSSMTCLFVFLFKRQNRKYVFKNYNRKFLWIRANNYFEYSYPSSKLKVDSLWFLFPFAMLFYICFVWYISGVNNLIETNPTADKILIQFLTGGFFIIYYDNYKTVRDSFPDPRRLGFLKKRDFFNPDPLILETRYIDFINNNIEWDNPCLTVGQSFQAKIKEFPKR
jgi:hypothetical protein